MPCRSQRSETGVCSRRCSRRIASFSWGVNRFRVFLDMGSPPLESIPYSSAALLHFRLKQNSRTGSRPVVGAHGEAHPFIKFGDDGTEIMRLRGVAVER